MNILVETPFKLTPHEILTSVAATLCLQGLMQSGVSERLIGELCQTPQYGYTASASDIPCGPRFVRITDIKSGIVNWDTLPYCKCDAPQLYKLEPGDILVARSGSVGKSFIVSDVPETSVFASYMIRLRVKPETQPAYIYWCLQSQQFWRQTMEARRGSAMKNINGKMLAGLRFPHPERPLQTAVVNFLEGFKARLSGSQKELPELPHPLEGQRRIVAKIDELASKIQNAHNLREQAAKETEALVNNQLRVAFSLFANRHGTASLGDLLIEAGYGSSEKCYSERIEGAVPVLRIPNVALEQIKLTDLKYARLSARDQERLILSKDDILVVRTNGSLDLVGRSAVVDELPEPMAFASYMIRLRFDQERIFPEYAQRTLRHLRMAGQLVDLARTTAGQYNVSLGRLRSTKIPVPPLSEQHGIVGKLDALLAEVEVLNHLQAETIIELDALLPSILDKAFKGEL